MYGGRDENQDLESFNILTENGWEPIDFPFNGKSLLSYCTVNVYRNKILFFGGQRKGKIKIKNPKKESLKKKEDGKKFIDPFDVLPDELIDYIAMFLEKKTLTKIALISEDAEERVDHKFKEKALEWEEKIIKMKKLKHMTKIIIDEQYSVEEERLKILN